jgi:hypothetical protein
MRPGLLHVPPGRRRYNNAAPASCGPGDKARKAKADPSPAPCSRARVFAREGGLGMTALIGERAASQSRRSQRFHRPTRAKTARVGDPVFRAGLRFLVPAGLHYAVSSLRHSTTLCRPCGTPGAATPVVVWNCHSPAHLVSSDYRCRSGRAICPQAPERPASPAGRKIVGCRGSNRPTEMSQSAASLPQSKCAPGRAWCTLPDRRR